MLNEALEFYLNKYQILQNEILLTGAFLHPNFKDFNFIKDKKFRERCLTEVKFFLSENFKTEQPLTNPEPAAQARLALAQLINFFSCKMKLKQGIQLKTQ